MISGKSGGPKIYEIDISWGTILKIVFVVFAAYVVYLERDVLFWIFLGVVLSVLFGPAIAFLQKLRFPRGVSVVFVYLSFLLLLLAAFCLFVPVLKAELAQIYSFFPVYFEKISPSLAWTGLDIFKSADAFSEGVRAWLVKATTDGFFDSVTAVLGGLLLTMVVFCLAVFFSLEEKNANGAIRSLVPRKYEPRVLSVWRRTKTQISGWFCARLAGAFAQGCLVGVSCAILGIGYPIVMGVIAFGLGLVPLFGSLTSGTIITLFALSESLNKAVLIAFLCFLFSQIKNDFIIPVLSKKYTELPTSLVLVSLLAGERMWGLAGAILAIPLFGIIYHFTVNILKKNID